jgi:hypothetical protein
MISLDNTVIINFKKTYFKLKKKVFLSLED